MEPLLRHSFPILFDLAINKFEIVADVWDQTVGNDNWKLNPYRDFNDWEVTLVVALLNSLQKKGSPRSQTRSLGRA